MSNPSFADGGSTDIALEHFERPLINNSTTPRAQNADTGPGPHGQNAEYTSLPTDITSDHLERPSIDTGLGPKGQDAGYISLPADEYATSHQAPTANWFYRITLDTWAPEALALFISAASIIAITAILARYGDGKSPEMSYGITLNAIVSILATTSRSMLIFAVSMCIGQLKWCWYHERKRKVEDIQTMDAASRGPLGSAILLFSLRVRPLASLGAAITILALAFDPFVQQILQYPSIPSLDLGKEASVLQSSNFVIDATSTERLNAISAGIWSGAERFDQQPSCPSGNCTWGEYPSTGWCTKCEAPVSHASITNCQLGEDTLDIEWLNTTDTCLVDFGHGNKVRVLGPYTSIVNGPKILNRATIVKNVVWSLELLRNNLSWCLSNETYAGVVNPVVALGYVHVQLCDEADLRKGLCITLAQECVLSLCTRQLKKSVVSGTTEIITINEDFGCLSQLHDDNGSALVGTATHCWQSGPSCGNIQFTNLTSFPKGTYTYPGLDFCSDGITVQSSDHAYPNKPP